MWFLFLAAATPADLLSKVQKNVADQPNLSAEFRQTNKKAVGTGKGVAETGKIYIKKPGLLRVDYEAPTLKHAVLDGERVWFYKPEEMSVWVNDTVKPDKVAGGLLFLLSPKPLKEAYTPEHFTGPDPQGGDVPADALRLLPKKEDPEVKEIVVYLDKDGMLSKAWVKDHLGNFNIFELRNVKNDPKLKKEAFLFVPPDGVKVIHVP